MFFMSFYNKDVNECLKTPEVCGPNSRCKNSNGSYNCSCLTGFTVTNSSEPVSTSNPCNGEHVEYIFHHDKFNLYCVLI